MTMRLLAAMIALLALLPGLAQAISFTGAMDNRTGFPLVPGFTAQSLAWNTGFPGAGLRLEWQADNESAPGLWTYRYRMVRGSANRKGFAFFDIETAADLGASNLKSRSVLSARTPFGATVPTGLSSVTISDPVSFSVAHDFGNARVTEANFATALNKSDLSHYSGDPGRVPTGVPGAGASATASVGPVPHPFRGVRVTFPGSFSDLAYVVADWEFSVVTDRVPMWGSFFGWGDQTVVEPYWYANFYNDNIDAGSRPALPPADSTDGTGPYRGWILVPGPLPVVVATVPADGDGEANTSASIRAVFNNLMDPLTINENSFNVPGVAGTVSFDPESNSASFISSLPLAPGTLYHASIGSGARDLAGNAVTETSWSFTTSFGPPRFPDGILVPGGSATTIADALIALRIAVQLDQATPEILAHGDLAPFGPDGFPRPDGRIEVADALGLLRKAVGLIGW